MSLRSPAPPIATSNERLLLVLHAGAETAPPVQTLKTKRRVQPAGPPLPPRSEESRAALAKKKADDAARQKTEAAKLKAEAFERQRRTQQDDASKPREELAIFKAQILVSYSYNVIKSAQFPEGDDKYGKGREAREFLNDHRGKFTDEQIRTTVYTKMLREFEGTSKNDTTRVQLIEKLAREFHFDLDTLEKKLLVDPKLKPLPLPIFTPPAAKDPTKQKHTTPEPKPTRESERDERAKYKNQPPPLIPDDQEALDLAIRRIVAGDEERLARDLKNITGRLSAL